MAETVKLIISDGDQVVRLPKQYHFDTKEVSIRHGKLGDVILSPGNPMLNQPSPTGLNYLP